MKRDEVGLDNAAGLQGFTTLEVVIVVVCVGILAALLVLMSR